MYSITNPQYLRTHTLNFRWTESFPSSHLPTVISSALASYTVCGSDFCSLSESPSEPSEVSCLISSLSGPCSMWSQLFVIHIHFLQGLTEYLPSAQCVITF